MGVVEDAVYTSLRERMPERAAFDRRERFTEDLRLSPDDISAVILDVQKRLNVRVQYRTWQQVRNIGEMIGLLSAVARRRRRG